MSHEWNCRCETCEREAAWQSETEPDWHADDEQARYEAGGEHVAAAE